MRRILELLILIVVMPVSLPGQLAPVSDQYILNPLTINPAYAGNRGALNIAAFYRNQWVGISGAPKTMSLAVDGPLLDGKIGLGINISNDRIGVTRENRFNTNYSFKIGMNDRTLSLGLGAGIITTNTAWSDLVVADPEDRNSLVDSRVYVVPDFSFGIYYSNHNYFAGFSVPKLLGNEFNFDKNRYIPEFNPDQYIYLFNTGYVFNLNPRTKFFPSTLVTYSRGEQLQYDISAHFRFINILWVGATYRSTQSITGLLQLAVNNQLRVAYTYNFDFGMLGRYNNGSHEIMLRYEFRYKVDVVNPLML